MTNYISIIGALLVISLAVYVSLKCNTEKLQRIIFVCLLIVVISGFGFYGFGLSAADATLTERIINAFRTIEYTISMFGGGEKFDTLMKVDGWFAHSIMWQIIYWIVHMMAVFVTASAVLITWGKKLLNRVKLMVPTANIGIVYCNNTERYRYVAEMEKEKHKVIYVGDFSKDVNNKLADYAVRYVSESDMDTNGKWLRSALLFRKKNKKINVICADNDDSKNSAFLHKLLKSFEALELDSRNIKIHVLGENVISYEFLAEMKDREGNRYVTEIYTISELVAHKLILKAMPYETMEFNTDTCQAKGNFRAMIIGFGDVGQSILRYLVRYSQFLGSEFKADVFDGDADNCAGLFREIYSDMLTRYDIRIHSVNAFSQEIYSYFSSADKINYLVVCTGDDKTNKEIIKDLQMYRYLHGENFAEKAVIASCTKGAINIISDTGVSGVVKPADVHEMLNQPVDILARHFNDLYYREKVSGQDISEDELRDLWYKKDPMDRLSSISSAEFTRTYVACSGSWDLSKEETEKLISEKLIRILPELEHMRWNAFESSMGVSPMSAEEFRENVAKCDKLIDKALKSDDEKDFKAAKQQFSITRKNLGPNGIGGKHVCMAEWDQLDELWEIYEPMLLKYNELLEKHGERKQGTLNFKQLDEKNIYHMLDIK